MKTVTNNGPVLMVSSNICKILLEQSSGWRNKKLVRSILNTCLKEDANYDAGARVNLLKPRKRKLFEAEVKLASKMLRSGTSTSLTTTVINHTILHSNDGRGPDDVVARNTLIRTLKQKYNVKVKKRQKKGTGSKDKNSIWALARVAFAKQLGYQLGVFFCLQYICIYIR